MRVFHPSHITFVGLETVNWAALRYAYGGGTDVPKLLKATQSANRPKREDAWEELNMGVVHQGDLYSASAATVPFLLQIAAHPAARGREEALDLLGTILEACQTWRRDWWNQGPFYWDEVLAALRQGADTYRLFLNHDEEHMRWAARELWKAAEAKS